MTASDIRLIVFDMDGVLAHLDYEKRMRALEAMTGRSAEFIQRAIYDSDFERSAEAGAYPTGSEYLSEFNRRIDSSLSRDQWIAARRDAMTPIAGTLEIARRLSVSMPLATLTNNGSLLKEAIAEILPAAHEVFGTSFRASFEFGARKPDPEVFRRLVAHYDVTPHRVLFIDDQPDYIEGARAAGLRTILFTSPMSLIEQLAGHGVMI